MKSLINRVNAHNTLASFINDTAVKLIDYCQTNTLTFKKDCSLSKKSDTALNDIITDSLADLDNKRVRCYIENTTRFVISSFSGSIILKADIWYNDTDEDYSSCSYIHKYHYFYFVGSEVTKPNYSPIELITEQMLIDGQNRINEIDSLVSELNSEKYALQSLLN